MPSAVADLAMTLLLALTRRLLAADDYVRSGGWADSKPSPMLRAPRGLRGRRIGVYGMGEIGRKIAARAAAFETEVGLLTAAAGTTCRIDYSRASANWSSGATC